MLRSLAWTGLVLLGGAASAQQPLATSRVHPITSTIRDAGVYHLVTGTWTRKASQAALGFNTIYDNTCSSGYFSGFSGDHFIDEGRIPSPSGPSDANNRPGCSTQYTVDGFQIAYCTDQLFVGTWTFNFHESYASCSTVVGVTPTATLALTNLPGANNGTCWLITIDLDAPPQSASLAFNLMADGDGTFSGVPDANLFGWECFTTVPASSSTLTGPIISGDPAVCLGYDGTRWDPVVNYSEAGTGMSTLNQFRIEQGPTTVPGCYFFQNVAMSSFHLELYSEECGGGFGYAFCFGDGVAGWCPCQNHSVPGNNEGCRHSFGVGGRLRVTGTPSISNDTLTLLGSQMPNASALYFQGTTQTGAQFGDGKRCAGGTTIRLKTVLNVGGASQYPQPGDPPVSVQGQITVPGVRTYQVWFRNAAAFCTPATFNLTNGQEIVWGA